jgi:NAD(P)-dependent dehydrogenase (short-subunit alcohol dehydrogenase family)
MIIHHLDHIAGSGIGQATAVAYAQAGCRNLTLVDMNVAGLQRTKELIKSTDATVKTLELVVDVSDESAVGYMVKSTINTFGGLDYGECHPPCGTITSCLT